MHPKLQNGPKSKLLKRKQNIWGRINFTKTVAKKNIFGQHLLEKLFSVFFVLFWRISFLSKTFSKKLDATGLMNGSVRWRLQLFKNNKNILFYSWFLFSNHDCGQTVFFEIFYILFTTVTRQIKMDLKANWFSFFNSSGFSCCPLVRYLKSSGQIKKLKITVICVVSEWRLSLKFFQITFKLPNNIKILIFKALFIYYAAPSGFNHRFTMPRYKVPNGPLFAINLQC